MIRTITLLVLVLFTEELFAWGAMGHRIVGQIADDNLNPKAKKSIEKILGDQTLAQVSTWADMIRSDPNWDFVKPWHFVDLPDGQTYSDVTPNPQGDVIQAISAQIEVLKNEKSTNEEKQNALKFIVHFVGDIHQPLHAGRPDDRGGNTIKVKFNDRTMNLHSLWDSGMIDHQQIGYEDYARQLQSRPEKSAIKDDYDLSEITFSQVLKENMSYRRQIYNFKVQETAGTPVVLGEKYFNENLATMNSRMLLAGKRLSFLFNSVFK